MDYKLKRIYAYLSENQLEYIECLRDFVAIKSISTHKDFRPEVVRAIYFIKDMLLKMKAEVNCYRPGKQKYYDGSIINLPPVLFATLGTDLRKYNVLIYGHVDVRAASYEDGWSSDPWQLFDHDGNLYGRGATDNKGPLLAWIFAIRAFQKLHMELPVNIKFVIEGMEEAGSEGLAELLYDHKASFLKTVDFVAVSDNFWLNTRKPCITYGVRGLTYFFVEVVTSHQHLHSGVHGGAISEAMNDCVYLMNSLIDNSGRIQVPGLYEEVVKVTDDENLLYEDMDFQVDEYCTFVGVKKTKPETEIDVLQHRWRHPSLSMHGVQHAFNNPGAKAMIPRKVVGKFSIRIAPTQDPKNVVQLVKEHLQKKFDERNSGCLLDVLLFHDGKPWTTDPRTPYFEAAKRAVKRVWKTDPDLTREGASIPVMAMLQRVVNREMLMMPISSADDNPHLPNEKIVKKNFVQGMKQMAAFFFEVADLDIDVERK